MTRCAACGYDLSGSPGRCPECGDWRRATTAPRSARRATCYLLLGASMVAAPLLLAWLEDAYGDAPGWVRPIGYAAPLLMVAGSIIAFVSSARLLRLIV